MQLGSVWLIFVEMCDKTQNIRCIIAGSSCYTFECGLYVPGWGARSHRLLQVHAHVELSISQLSRVSPTSLPHLSTWPPHRGLYYRSTRVQAQGLAALLSSQPAVASWAHHHPCNVREDVRTNVCCCCCLSYCVVVLCYCSIVMLLCCYGVGDCVPDDDDVRLASRPVRVRVVSALRLLSG